jgi:isoquinoline 1-oxidoreductase alpha subunit
MSQFTLQINGQARRVEAVSDTPLLWLLRDGLGLVGTKYGCGVGLCGACTVHIDGQPTRASLTAAATLAGKFLSR